MRASVHTTFGLVLTLGLFMAGSSAMAYSETEHPYVNGALRKLGRGVANVGTAVLEIPDSVGQVTNQDGFLAGSTVGLTKGLFRGAARALIGAFEVATFYLEWPKGFVPIMEPEFVFKDYP